MNEPNKTQDTNLLINSYYHVISKHEHSLQRQLPIAKVEQILKTRSQ